MKRFFTVLLAVILTVPLIIAGAGCNNKNEATQSQTSSAADVTAIKVAESRIVFDSLRDNNYEIYIMNGDGSGQSNLTNNAAQDFNPSISPDGSRIAFVSDRAGSNEIYIMNADGTGQTRLTDDPAVDLDPCFSPDGSKIAYTYDRDGN